MLIFNFSSADRVFGGARTAFAYFKSSKRRDCPLLGTVPKAQLKCPKRLASNSIPELTVPNPTFDSNNHRDLEQSSSLQPLSPPVPPPQWRQVQLHPRVNAEYLTHVGSTMRITWMQARISNKIATAGLNLSMSWSDTQISSLSKHFETSISKACSIIKLSLFH